MSALPKDSGLLEKLLIAADGRRRDNGSMPQPRKTWSEKMAEARARRKPTPRKPTKSRRTSAYGSVVGDVFDVVGQLTGVTDDWVTSKKKRRR